MLARRSPGSFGDGQKRASKLNPARKSFFVAVTLRVRGQARHPYVEIIRPYKRSREMHWDHEHSNTPTHTHLHTFRESATSTIVLSKNTKNEPPNHQKWSKIPPRSIPRDHVRARKHSNTFQGVKKMNLADRSPGQVGQRTSHKPPREAPRTLPSAPKRFQEPSRRGLSRANLENLIFDRCTVRNPCF